jgi:hypothetical protein
MRQLPKARKRVFIASSIENLPLAEQVRRELVESYEIQVWTDDGVFPASSFAIPSLVDCLKQQDFGIFIFTPDDKLKIRQEPTVRATRDNVVFEYGLSIGILGLERSFYLIPRDLKKYRRFSDVWGVTPIEYVDASEVGLKDACLRIRKQIEEKGHFDQETRLTPTALKAFAEKSCPISELVQKAEGKGIKMCPDRFAAAKYAELVYICRTLGIGCVESFECHLQSLDSQIDLFFEEVVKNCQQELGRTWCTSRLFLLQGILIGSKSHEFEREAVLENTTWDSHVLDCILATSALLPISSSPSPEPEDE